MGHSFASLKELVDVMRAYGVTRFYAKRLAPNDNSKNQVYLGGGFEALNVLPHGEVETDFEQRAGSVRRRDKASVKFEWIHAEGSSRAPDAQLILYPKYPEVRMSGFLRGAAHAPNDLMTSRDPGRVLFFGVVPSGLILGYVSAVQSGVVRELDTIGDLPEIGVFLNLTKLISASGRDPKSELLSELKRIHQKGWIAGQRMHSDGEVRPYAAPNGGGYTLEAELGIIPNGVAEPDFLGWELKQYAVRDFASLRATSPVTLMTPEPTVGRYSDDFHGFMASYGYDDTKGRPNRRNFGGIYRNLAPASARTGVRMVLEGYDAANGKIDDLGGKVLLVNGDDDVAAGWEFANLLNHWNRKHAQAAYVPSESSGKPKSYRYADRVQFGTGTDFFKFMRLIHEGKAYLDPAVKVENGKIKKRNQFRVNHRDLAGLYGHFETVTL
ncbi:hypothetical protein FDP25_05840 [Roseovarius sp. A21]|uniref:MvaI/BcnI restriction endonuclease domain-containing protein n=1 Tax=Roseovarius bejariae TaxID=2576383 RepID=A0A844CJQ9_9RHOB|nr:hypothetical protein [Roseovarius bejariae]